MANSISATQQRKKTVLTSNEEAKQSSKENTKPRLVANYSRGFCCALKTARRFTANLP